MDHLNSHLTVEDVSSKFTASTNTDSCSVVAYKIGNLIMVSFIVHPKAATNFANHSWLLLDSSISSRSSIQVSATYSANENNSSTLACSLELNPNSLVGLRAPNNGRNNHITNLTTSSIISGSFVYTI